VKNINSPGTYRTTLVLDEHDLVSLIRYHII